MCVKVVSHPGERYYPQWGQSLLQLGTKERKRKLIAFQVSSFACTDIFGFIQFKKVFNYLLIYIITIISKGVVFSSSEMDLAV